jgi:hypothetical protein
VLGVAVNYDNPVGLNNFNILFYFIYFGIASWLTGMFIHVVNAVFLLDILGLS